MHVPLTSSAPSKQAAAADTVLDGVFEADCDRDSVPVSDDCPCVTDAATLAALLLFVVELSEVGDGVPEKGAPLCDPEAEFDDETPSMVIVVVPVVERVAPDERLSVRDAL